MRFPLELKVLADTPIGAVGIVWAGAGGGPRVVRVLLPGAKTAPEAVEGTCPEIEKLAGALRKVLSGQAGAVPLEPAALELCPPFQRAVLRAAARIPRGKVTTYGELAANLGRPGAARAVGNALAANPFPLIVPCHRVIRSDGTIGGFTGGEDLKRRLLELEGIAFDRAGRLMVE